VVVAPRLDAAGPPRIAEQEPNDSPELAQVLAINADWPVVSVEGSLRVAGEHQGKDVDVFKLTVPGDRQAPGKVPPSLDAGLLPRDARAQARRLSIELAQEGGTGLGLQVLDEAQKPLEAISLEPGAGSGIPNLAVSPGLTYYLRIKAAAKPVKAPAVPTTACRYQLTLQLGDFGVADEREPNDTMETATPVDLLGSVELAGYHGWHHDQDYYRISLPDVVSALDVELGPVEDVVGSLQVLDGAGARLAFGRGHKGESLALRNVILRPAAADAAVAMRQAFVVVRAEGGENRGRQYVLRLGLGTPRLDAEKEPNDSPEQATPVSDGTYAGYLPAGDIDYFRYDGEGRRNVTFEVSFPKRVRGKIEAYRPDKLPAGMADSKKARQTVSLADVATLGQPLFLRVSAGRGDGNGNEPYTLKIASAPSPGE
jgi:hypothetical protein